MPLRSHHRPNRRTARALLLTLGLVLGLGAAAGARAQSLQTLFDAARGYDATFLSARASLDAAQYRLDQTYALRRPSVGLAVSGSRSISQTPGASTQSTTSDVYGATVNGSQTLFNRANDKTIAQGEKSLEVARADFESAEQDLIVRVSQAYFDVLAAQDALATAQSSLKAIAELVASAKRNFEVGTATITDTREAQARYDLARAQEIQAENDLRTKRIALASLVGKTDVEPRPLAQPVTLPAIEPDDAEAWVTTADADHPAIRKARLAYEVARLETEKARAGGLPTLDAVASAGISHSSGTGVLTSIPGSTKTATVGLELNWPLYTGGSIQNRIKETLALEDKARDDLQGAMRAVAQGTRVAFFDLQSGMAQVQALEAAESSSKLALEATQLGYKVGVRVNIDVLNSQTQLYTTERDLAKARYDVIVGGLKLRQAAGALGQGDVEAVNRLLAR
ncbi:MAG: TolC family outer membrane protein [Burkholderiales bacterium]|nr:TolC family outer membrane protein [Burkholderiales bacterium]